ncbi:MAG: DNA-3-methyladenine glycosylase I [Bacteroidetes bacterium]|jgi:DNA-3-methyladenine glycosylase I|nr:DNA-3-methyladenine glycosylase I [Bacteroidota bacterium]
MDNKPRCDWATHSELEKEYHDTEWGVPNTDDRHLFEMLILEGAQAGLSWLTVLKKRVHYREAFDHFDPEKVARYDEAKRAELLSNPGIIRNRLKVDAAIQNAKVYLEIVEKHGSFSQYIWSFVDADPIVNHFEAMNQVPAETEISRKMSKQMKKDGFKFVGPTICYAYMQSVGMVNDHLTGCFRHDEV